MSSVDFSVNPEGQILPADQESPAQVRFLPNTRVQNSPDIETLIATTDR